MPAKHAKDCQCAECVRFRVSKYLERIHDQSRIVPESIDQTVAVRAHWRRHPGHLRKKPAERKALREALANLMKGGERS